MQPSGSTDACGPSLIPRLPIAFIERKRLSARLTGSALVVRTGLLGPLDGGPDVPAVASGGA